jgi:hypothetical protein
MTNGSDYNLVKASFSETSDRGTLEYVPKEGPEYIGVRGTITYEAPEIYAPYIPPAFADAYTITSVTYKETNE